MVDWPSTLPAQGLTGITDQFTGAKLVSEVDQGPPITRQRYTKARRPVDIPISLTNDQRAIFDVWFADETLFGVLSFNWIDPVSGATKVFKFRDADGPKWTGSGGGETRRHSAILSLEIW